MIRRVFDTDHLTEIKTPIFEGVEDIKVEIISCIDNPYKGMVNMALATWGSQLNKWPVLTPEERFHVALKVLQRKALPLGRESPVFLFGITGVTRSSFDQIARQRIGSTFSSLGWNNVHTQNGFRIPNEIVENEEYNKFRESIELCLKNCKSVYYELINSGISWQSAREVLPMGLLHWFYFSVTFEALQAFCSRRLCFSEKEDTVAVTWLMRERVGDKFPLLASFLRPNCDWTKKCGYHTGDSLPEEMGALFEPCGRNKCIVENPNVEFNRPSTKVDNLENDLLIRIPRSNDDLPVTEFDKLSSLDKELFFDKTNWI